MTPKDEFSKPSESSTKGGKKSDEKTDSSGINALTSAYFEWLQAHDAASLQYREAWSNAYNELIEALRKTQQEAWAPVHDALDKLQRAAAAASFDKDGWANWLGAQQEYVKLHSEIQSNQKLSEESSAAYQRFFKRQQEAFDAARQRQRDAQIKHIAAVQAVWSAIDPQAASNATLRAAAWAAQHAAYSPM
jgi:hypothetical protein